MKCSLETWKWQQEIRKLESEQADEEEKNVFKIANEFIIKEEPDLNFKKNVYSEGFLKLCQIKKESFDTDGDDDGSPAPFFIKNENEADLHIAEDEPQQQSTLANELLQQTDSQRTSLYQRRSDLLKNKENEAHYQPSESPYLKKLEQIISGNKMSKMHKEATGQQAPTNTSIHDGFLQRGFSPGGSSATNASLYKSCKESDNLVLNSLSGLINKLADETKIDSLSEQSATMQFEAFRRSISVEKRPVSVKVERDSPAKPKIVQEENEPSVTRARSLIDEIMSSEGYVASSSISLANLGKPTGQLIHPTINPPAPVQRFLVDSSLNDTLNQAASPSEPGDLGLICSSDLSEFNVNSLQTAKESDLFNLTNQHLRNQSGGPFVQDYDLPLPAGQRDASPPSIPRPNVDANAEDYIVSKSDDGETQFKLHFVDKGEADYYEYEPYLHGSPIAAIDPRMKKIFPNFMPDSSDHSESPLSEYLSRSHLLSNSGDNLDLLSTLSDLRFKKLI